MFAVLADNPSRARAVSGKVSTVLFKSNDVWFRGRPLNKKSDFFHEFSGGISLGPWQAMIASLNIDEESFGDFSRRPAAR